MDHRIIFQNRLRSKLLWKTGTRSHGAPSRWAGVYIGVFLPGKERAVCPFGSSSLSHVRTEL